MSFLAHRNARDETSESVRYRAVHVGEGVVDVCPFSLGLGRAAQIEAVPFAGDQPPWDDIE